MGSTWADLDAELKLYDGELRAYGEAHFMQHSIKGFPKTAWFRRASMEKIRLDQEAARNRGHSGMLLLYIIEELGYPSLRWFRDDHVGRQRMISWLDQGIEQEVRDTLEQFALYELQDSGMLRHIHFMVIANRTFQAGHELTVGMGPGHEGEPLAQGATMRGVLVTGAEWDEFGFLTSVDMEWETDEPLIPPDEVLDQQKNDDTIELGSGDALDTHKE